MRVSLRAKLLVVVAVNALALIVLVLAGSFIADRVQSNLEDIRERYVPKVAARPALQRQLERLQRSFQDAVAAADYDLLAATRAHKDTLVAQLTAAGTALDSGDVAALVDALDDYYDAAYAVSRELIEGDANPIAIEAMQGRRERVEAQLDRVTAFDEAALAAAFDSASRATRTATRVRWFISAACLIAVLALSLWISRGILRQLGELTDGFERFGEGRLDAKIPIRSRDELGDVAARANEMADSLRQLEAERARVDWLKSGRAGLAQEVRGELEPEEVANHAVAFLARYVGAPVGALYYGGPDAPLRLLGRYGVSEADAEPAATIARGDGLIGQAALGTEVSVVTAPAGHLTIRSGMVEAAPRAVALIPLVHAGHVTGVLELALLEPWTDQHEELLVSVREGISVAIEVATARAATRTLLAETTAQAAALEKQHVALEGKNAELVDARQRLEQKADELAAASRYKSQFLANMSHELRTPLNAIIGFAELMHDGVVTSDMPQYREFMGDILTSGKHLLQLINDVLDLSKVEAGKLEFYPEPIDLGAVIGEVLAILRTTAAGKRIVVDSQVDDALGDVVLDPARLKQVLYNYASNALKFTPDGGRVTVRALAEGADRLRIEVEDTGVGIAPDDLGRLFGEFQQIDGGRAKREGGTGLGLALTKRLVEAQGGSVGVRSEVGAGSVFFAVLPAHARATDPPVDQPQPAPARVGAPAVLVIEDSPRDQAELVDTLESAGYAVQVAANGKQALALCREHVFDAITLDLLLPDMSGLQVLSEIRADGLNRDVPVFVITVVTEPGAVAGFTVHDVMAKPLREGALLDGLARASVVPHKPGPVLVIDDDPGALKLMATTLRQLGYDTRCERDGASALNAARDELPSAIVLDLLMPGMNGFEFLDQLRNDDLGRHVPVIVWSVLDLSQEQHARLRASAQAVVSKGHGGSTAVVAELEAFLSPAPGEV